jgi:hypothetical protein
MTKQVNGFLANDGSFFEHEPECMRYEYMKSLESSCESHGVEFENFMTLINAWSTQIEGYYNADDNCKEHHTGKAQVHFNGQEPLLPPEEDRADVASGDKDAKGFLEQQIRRNL